MTRILIAFSIMLPQAQLSAESPSDFFNTRATVLGFATEHGEACNSILLETIKVSKDASLPLYAVLTTERMQSGQPLFGKNWSMPLFEATVMAIDEQTIEAQTATGKKIDLYQLPGEVDRYTSKDGRWVGKRVGNDFELSSSTGGRFKYKNGKIASVTLPTGEELNIQRHADSLSVTSNNRSLISVKLSAENLADEITADRLNLKFKYNYEVPSTSQLQGKTVIVGLNPMMTHIIRGKEQQEQLALQVIYDPDADELSVKDDTKPSAAGTGVFPAFPQLAWHVSDGKIVSDATASYKIIDTQHANSYHLERTGSAGLLESIMFDSQTGILKYVDPNGILSQTAIILTPGDTFGKVRSSRTSISETTLSESKYSYGVKGELLRAEFSDSRQRLSQ
ncbi:MAG: hypothetical protein B7Z37_27340, partial [Verrucomicrobia bacterium 12-59-8]